MQERTPERIYNWLNTQLSIARHYGGCTYNGADYVIAYGEEGQPLLRSDLLKKPKRGKKGDAAAAPELPLQPNVPVKPGREATSA